MIKKAKKHHQTHSSRHHERSDPGRFKVSVPISFIVTSLFSSCLLAFAVGRAARNLFLNVRVTPAQYQTPPPSTSVDCRNGSTHLSRPYDSPQSVPSSWLLNERDSITLIGEDFQESDDIEEVKNNHHDDDDDNDEEALARHLIVDIDNVDAAFLNSEQRLAAALLEVVTEARLSLKSYQCHGHVPLGVTCVGLLKEHHIALHTWPERGVISLDLDIDGDTPSFSPVLSIMERVFAVPRTSIDSSSGSQQTEPGFRWAHHFRGFDLKERSNDLSVFVLSDIRADIKKEVLSVDTDFQKIDIYDLEIDGQVIRTMKTLLQRRGLLHQSSNSLLLRPDRILMLDGCIQSSMLHEAAYHEALVHPGMFAHRNPKRVAIVGGGEGATLREVLKHKTVQEVMMIEIDEMMVNVSREYMPEWSDCSNLEGRSPCCFDDQRVSLYCEDALGWFVSRYPKGNEPELPLDIIIMDALDPESDSPFAKALYNDNAFVEAFYQSLSEDGILVFQIGEAPDVWDEPNELASWKAQVLTIRMLEKVGFESIHVYEESHCDFGGSWLFVVALKSYSSRKMWYANSAEIDLAIKKRAAQTKSRTSPFRYSDGATMVSYQLPSRPIENVYCRHQPTPRSCINDEYLYNSEISNTPASVMEVKTSKAGKNAGRGLFTTVDIPAGSYIYLETAVHSVRFFPSTRALISTLENELPGPVGDEYEVLEYYMSAYGFSSRIFGEEEVIVDSNVVTFVNHGCNGTYNVGEITTVDENTADPNNPIESLDGKIHGSSTFDPVVDRHLLHSLDRSNVHIQAGEELLDNYLAFIGSEQSWASDVDDLRAQCSGEATEFSVTDYEDGNYDNS